MLEGSIAFTFSGALFSVWLPDYNTDITLTLILTSDTQSPNVTCIGRNLVTFLPPCLQLFAL